MEHRCAETVDVRRRLHASAKQLGRRVTHRAYGSDTFLMLCHPARDSKINKHHATAVAINHQVSRLEVTIDNRLRSRMKIFENVRDLHAPISNSSFINAAANSRSHSRRQV